MFDIARTTIQQMIKIITVKTTIKANVTGPVNL